MRFAKKLLAAVSALAMATTMLSSMAVVQAADPGPIVTLKIAETEEGSEIYDITVNLDVTQCEKGNYVYGASFNLPLGDYIDSSNLLDKELNMETFEEEYVNIAGGPAKYATFTPNVVDGTIYYAFADMSGSGQATPIAMDIITFKNLKLKDGVTTDDIPLGFTEFKIQVGSSSKGTTNYTLDVDTLNKITFPGNMTDEPDPDDVVIESVGTFEPTGAEAEAMPNQRAVASIATIAANEAATGITWSIQVTGGENEGPYDKTFDLATLDVNAEMKFGLIVEYDTIQAESVAITGAELVTAPTE